MADDEAEMPSTEEPAVEEAPAAPADDDGGEPAGGESPTSPAEGGYFGGEPEAAGESAGEGGEVGKGGGGDDGGGEEGVGEGGGEEGGEEDGAPPEGPADFGGETDVRGAREPQKISRMQMVDAQDLPRSYSNNSPEELLVLEYVENFRRQFVQLYPNRKQLLLVPRNECGVEKFICTTVRPTQLEYSNLYDLEDCATFVADLMMFV